MRLNDFYEDDAFMILIMDKMIEDLRNIVIDFENPMDENLARDIFR